MPTTWRLSRGLLGFPDFVAPTFRFLPDCDQLYGLLADDSGIQFVLARPGAFFPNLTIELSDPVASGLGLREERDADVWVIVSQTPEGFFANLRGPLVVNRRTGAAVQVVLDDTYPTAASLAA